MAANYIQRINKLNWGEVLNYLLKKWYFLLLALLAGGVIGYWATSMAKPKYSAVFSFVLSTDSRSNNNLAGLASQLGFDAITSGPDNIFSGDNIIELFKSRKLIAAALQSVIDNSTNKTLLVYIAEHQFDNIYRSVGPFKGAPSTFSPKQRYLYRRVVTYVANSFTIFRKDKKLVIYSIKSTNTNPDIAYYVTKYMLTETAQYFIATKTETASMSVKLLRHEADSLSKILGNIYSATAANNDRTFNSNPSVSIQRSASMFNQAKVMAYSAAFTEVMRNLEIAKINLQKESPLYRIIDEPELPLIPDAQSKIKYIAFAGGVSITIMIISLIVFFIFVKKDH
jgi:uncharacterized protein involved in exopolysaccharide biosynthesis